MFSLPAIGVSACTRTISHATDSLINEASPLITRAASVMSMTAATQQHLSFAASAPRCLSRQAVRSFHTQHDSVRGRVTLSAARLGPRPAMHKALACFAGRVLCREIDGPMFEYKGERFSFCGVQSRVPEVSHP
ncbi:hypothetical protein DBO86_04300 [Pseudomonas indoloxydans]|uniref:Uncharacterized protein n=1 Tax=Ectopseudomonas oleovorans TaxID=301 RepID=A0A2T5PR99_ECTOL|nr:hypothetical protein [Pseudomonas indoloxydans]PTU80256.1 hypothetical protein DBO86_04300 [Pseudomonas indoloxydans]